MTLDNASNNKTLIDELGDLLDGFQGSLTRVRCFAHILNLVVKVCIPHTCHFYHSKSRQSVLSQFSHKTKATEDAIEEAEDAAALDELDDDLDNDLDNEPVEDNTPENEEDVGLEDEIDVSVAESDDAIIDAVGAGAGDDCGVPTLTREEVNLGKFAVTKVRVIPFNNLE